MGHRGYRVQVIWDIWAMGHRGYRVQVIWDTWAMWHMGNRAFGQLAH